MATAEVGQTRQPADAQWKPIVVNEVDIQQLGEFAVKVQNKTHCWDLKLHTLDKAWELILASDYGHLYLLHLKALDNNKEAKYQAIVWVKPKECVNIGCPDRRTLVSFKELSE